MTEETTPEDLDAIRARIAADQAIIAAAEKREADSAREALAKLVAMPEFTAVDKAMKAAQTLNPANTELSYAISMFDRLKANR